MRGATRLLAVCGLIAILVAVVDSGSGAAKVAASARGPAMAVGRLGSSPFAASNRTPLGTPIHSNTFNGSPVPIPQLGGTRLTSTLLNGSAMGSQSPAPVLMTSGCQVLMLPKGFDSATHEIFTVSVPHINVTNLNPTGAPVGTNV